MLDMKQVQDHIYDIFIEFDRVCQKHGLRYSMEGGTLLGAVKYKNFVPWDDDIDVIMIREEYDRFLRPRFGENYLTELPDESLRKPSHNPNIKILRGSVNE